MYVEDDVNPSYTEMYTSVGYLSYSDSGSKTHGLTATLSFGRVLRLFEDRGVSMLALGVFLEQNLGGGLKGYDGFIGSIMINFKLFAFQLGIGGAYSAGKTAFGLDKGAFALKLGLGLSIFATDWFAIGADFAYTLCARKGYIGHIITPSLHFRFALSGNTNSGSTNAQADVTADTETQAMCETICECESDTFNHQPKYEEQRTHTQAPENTIVFTSEPHPSMYVQDVVNPSYTEMYTSVGYLGYFGSGSKTHGLTATLSFGRVLRLFEDRGVSMLPLGVFLEQNLGGGLKGYDGFIGSTMINFKLFAFQLGIGGAYSAGKTAFGLDKGAFALKLGLGLPSIRVADRFAFGIDFSYTLCARKGYIGHIITPSLHFRFSLDTLPPPITFVPDSDP